MSYMSSVNRSQRISILYFVSVALISCLASGCASSSFTLLPNSDPSKYSTVYVVPIENDAYNVAGEIRDRLRMMNYRVVSLIPRTTASYLVCQCSYRWSSEKANVHVELIDSKTGEAVYSGEGMYGLGWGTGGDVSGAVSRALEGLDSYFKQTSTEPHGPSVVSDTPAKPVSTSGTAFAVSQDGTFVTAYHLVKDASSICIRNEESRCIPAKLILSSQSNDIAVLRADTTFTSFLELKSCKEVEVGDHVCASSASVTLDES